MKANNILLCLLTVLGLSSCGSEFWMANRFVAQAEKVQVAVYFPEEARVSLVEDSEGEYSRVLDSVDTDLFLDIMYEAYADGLRTYGVDVYIPETPENIQVDSVHWLVMLSQVEMQGLFTDYVDYLFDFTDEYNYTFTLNTVNVASWYDINDGEWCPTLFDEFNLRDDFSSRVTTSRANGTQYHYNITPLKATDVYDFAVYLGRRHAAFTFDYMMNRQVAKEMRAKKGGGSPRYKLRWDPSQGSFFFQTDEEGFIELKAEDED